MSARRRKLVGVVVGTIIVAAGLTAGTLVAVSADEAPPPFNPATLPPCPTETASPGRSVAPPPPNGGPERDDCMGSADFTQAPAGFPRSHPIDLSELSTSGTTDDK
ncbi:MAG: hypothetical protein WDA27_09735 [Actinomycetota bacterium]